MTTAEQFRLDGNDALTQQNNPLLAIQLYTKALKHDRKNKAVFSNRSLAYLRCRQYAEALQDALAAVQIDPDWAKGYFRAAEVYVNTEHYHEAITFYQKALQLSPTDETMGQRLKDAEHKLCSQTKEKVDFPRYGMIGLGSVGSILILVDQFASRRQTLHSWFAMGLLLIICIGFGYAGGHLAQWYRQTRRESFLLQQTSQTERAGVYGKTSTPTVTAAPFPTDPVSSTGRVKPSSGDRQRRVFRKVEKKPTGVGKMIS
eukprot:m.146091 g.146091  ORF g.146091 m.146091 type:complete len:259 (+) comp17758_c0_seq4:94-870(+)